MRTQFLEFNFPHKRCYSTYLQIVLQAVVGSGWNVLFRTKFLLLKDNDCICDESQVQIVVFQGTSQGNCRDHFKHAGNVLLTLAIRSPTNIPVLTLISCFSGLFLTSFAQDNRECDQNLLELM